MERKKERLLLSSRCRSPGCSQGVESAAARDRRHGAVAWCSRRGGGSSRWNVAPVVCHVCFDQVTGAQSTVEGQFSRKDTGGDDAGELARVVTRGGWVSASYAKKVEHGGLGLEDGSTAKCTDFYRRHGDRDLEVAVDAVGKC